MKPRNVLARSIPLGLLFAALTAPAWSASASVPVLRENTPQVVAANTTTPRVSNGDFSQGDTDFTSGYVSRWAQSPPVKTERADFDGNRQEVLQPPPVANDFSIAFWVNTRQSPGGGAQWFEGRGLVDASTAPLTNDFGVSLMRGGRIGFGIGNPDTTVQSSISVNNGTWRHVAVTRSSQSGDVAIFIDGKQNAAGNARKGRLNGAPRLTVGSLQTNNNYFDGALSNLQFYDRILPADAIAELATRTDTDAAAPVQSLFTAIAPFQPGQYYVGNASQYWPPGLLPVEDPTEPGGDFLIASSSGETSQVLWRAAGQPISVTAGMSYAFTVQAAGLMQRPPGPATIQLQVGTGDPNAPTWRSITGPIQVGNTWTAVTGNWTATDSGPVQFRLLAPTPNRGLIFGVDNIAVRQLPGPPTDILAVPTDRGVNVAFTPASTTDGVRVVNYEYSLDPRNEQWVPVSPAVTGPPIQLTGLQNGATYRIALRAATDYGPGTASSPVAFTPAAPAKPAIIRIVINAVPGNPATGTVIRITASDLRPGSPGRILLYSDPIVLGQFTADAKGMVDTTVTLPATLAAGSHRVVVEAVGIDGNPVFHVAYISVDDKGVITGISDDQQKSGIDPRVVPPAPEPLAPSPSPSPSPSASPTPTAEPAPAPAPAAEPVAGPVAAAAAIAAPVAQPAPAAPVAPEDDAPRDPDPRPTPTPERPSAQPEPAPPFDTAGHIRTVATLTVAAFAAMTLLGNGSLSRGAEAAELEGVAAADLDNDDLATGPGDASGTWRWPFTDEQNALVKKAAFAVAPISPLTARIITDGGWARAMLGSVSSLLWLGGLTFGVLSVVDTAGVARPPALLLLLAIVCLGILDATAGLITWLVVTLGAAFSQNIATWADVRTLLGMGVLYVGVGLVASATRPMRRPLGDGAKHRFDRLADYLMMPILAVLVGAGTYTALNALSGREIVSESDVLPLQITVTLALWVRLTMEDLAARHYPGRLKEVTVTDLPEQKSQWRWGALVMQMLIFLLIAGAFFGLGLSTWLAAAMVAIPLILILMIGDRIPNSPTIHKWAPQGILRLVVMLLLGAWWTAFVLGDNPDLTTLEKAIALFAIPALIVAIVDLFGREGWQWPDTWTKRMLGVGLWAIAVALVFGLVGLGA